MKKITFLSILFALLLGMTSCGNKYEFIDNNKAQEVLHDFIESENNRNATPEQINEMLDLCLKFQQKRLDYIKDAGDDPMEILKADALMRADADYKKVLATYCNLINAVSLGSAYGMIELNDEQQAKYDEIHAIDREFDGIIAKARLAYPDFDINGDLDKYKKQIDEAKENIEKAQETSKDMLDAAKSMQDDARNMFGD